jgi:hypothetical protein
MLRKAHIYLAANSKPAIIAALHHNRDGICYEQDEVLTVPEWRANESLVSVVRSALDRFSFHDRNLRDQKVSDWGAYRASPCRSVREFQRSYLCLSVRPVNEAELFYIFEVQPFNEEEITLSATASRHDDEGIRRSISRLFDVCSRWDSLLSKGQ